MSGVCAIVSIWARVAVAGVIECVMRKEILVIEFVH